jgi:hypothetical protein
MNKTIRSTNATTLDPVFSKRSKYGALDPIAASRGPGGRGVSIYICMSFRKEHSKRKRFGVLEKHIVCERPSVSSVTGQRIHGRCSTHTYAEEHGDEHYDAHYDVQQETPPHCSRYV